MSSLKKIFGSPKTLSHTKQSKPKEGRKAEIKVKGKCFLVNKDMEYGNK